jgi:hypothetical protein
MVHSAVVRQGPITRRANVVEEPTILLEGGPRAGETDTLDAVPAVIGTGHEGGVYQRTEERRGGLVVYQWQSLTDAEVAALTRGDLRANQQTERPEP